MTSRIALRFTEDMRGRVTFGATDPREAPAGTALDVHLTVELDDVERFVADPRHAATGHGWVECAALGGRRPAQLLEFNLFVTGNDPAHREMLYRIQFDDVSGRALCLRGRKNVMDDRGLDAWPDTTTLYVELSGPSAGEDTGEPVLAAGVLRVKPLDFVRQLTTFRTSGGSRTARTLALVKFVRFFFAQLLHVYVPAARHGSRQEDGTR